MKRGDHILKTLVNQKTKYDDEFFIKLIKEHETYLYKAAYVYLGSKDEALDAMQEMAYKAYKNRKKIKDEKYLKAWLLKILLNYCKDRIKSKKRIVYLKDIENHNAETQSNSFEDQIQNNIVLRKALDLMKVTYKEVIILKYVNDMKIKDISKLLNKSEGTVKVWLHRGMEQLRNIVKEEALKDA